MLPAKVGLAAALLLALLPASAAAEEGFVGFEARYIPHIEDNGVPVETEGWLELTFYQTCDSLYYAWNSNRYSTLADHTETSNDSGVWYEKLDGTSGTTHYFDQNADMADGEVIGAYVVNFYGDFERASAHWEGDVELTKDWYDIQTIYKLPIPEGVLTPALAYKAMADRVAAGETSFTHLVSVIGLLDSNDPGYVTHASVTVEVVPSPFEGLELPQTPDQMFEREYSVVRISSTSNKYRSGVKTITYQLFENGLRGWILLEFGSRRYLYEPVTAHAVESKPCD